MELDLTAAAHDVRAVGGLDRAFRVLLDQEDGPALGVKLLEDLEDPVDHQRREAQRRLVEHDMHVIFRICENIQVLNFGKTMALGPPEKIRSDGQVIAAYLGEEGAAELVREIGEQRAED